MKRAVSRGWLGGWTVDLRFEQLGPRSKVKATESAASSCVKPNNLSCEFICVRPLTIGHFAECQIPVWMEFYLLCRGAFMPSGF